MTDRQCPIKVGTRVDCLFDDDYFRGTVDEVDDSEPARLRRIIFDDGDVREDVPTEDVELLLEPGCRVECLYEVGGILGKLGEC